MINNGQGNYGNVTSQTAPTGWNYNVAYEFFLTGNPHHFDYYQNTSDSLSNGGHNHNISDLDPRHYKNPKLILQYPMSYGDSLFDVYDGTRNSFGGPVTLWGNRTIEVDGEGTLILQQDTFTSVLRIRYIDSLWETFGSQPWLRVDTSYRWYADSLRYELLVYSSTGIPMGNYFTDWGLKTPPCVGSNAAFSDSVSQLAAFFTDMSSGGATISSWLWDFGDGNTSTSQSPNHNYAAAGVYTVCLTITDSCGSDSSCHNVSVTCALPTASFSANDSLLTVSFTDASTTTGNTNWSWSFGDGNNNSSQNPTHVYAQPGTYTVCLIVSDICGGDTICDTIAVDTALTGRKWEWNSNIRIWPNPAKEKIYISSDADLLIKRVRVMGMSGRLIKTIEPGFGRQVLSISLGEMAKGNYFLLIEPEAGSAAVPIAKIIEIR